MSEIKEKSEQGGLWQGVKNQSYGISGSFFKGRYLSRIKAYSVAEQRLPKHTDRQRRSEIFKGVTFFGLCYRLYSKLPELPFLRGFL